MKIGCPTHGCHFPKDFEETLKADCSLWVAAGLEELPKKWKRHIWRWYFSLKSDAIFLESGIALAVAVGGHKGDITKWEDVIPGYKKMNEKSRQIAQQEYIKAATHKEKGGLWKRLKSLIRKR